MSEVTGVPQCACGGPCEHDGSLAAEMRYHLTTDAEALRRVLALADEFDAQVPWPHSWIGNRIREAAGITE